MKLTNALCDSELQGFAMFAKLVDKMGFLPTPV